MNDKRITRLLKLLQMLQSGRRPEFRGPGQSLWRRRRTIFRDLETLARGGRAGRVTTARRGDFRSAGASFLPPTDFTAEEALSLIGAGRRNGPQPAAAILRSRLQRGAEAREQSARAAAAGGPPDDAGHQDSPRTRSAHLAGKSERLSAARAGDRKAARRARSNTKASPNGRRITTKLRPYQLLFSRRSWYVIGRSSLHREVRIFNLCADRVAEQLREPFTVPRSFDLDRYLGNAWHLIPSAGRDSHVVMRFKSLVAGNVAEVMWHKTQRTKFLPDGSLEFPRDGVRPQRNRLVDPGLRRSGRSAAAGPAAPPGRPTCPEHGGDV